MHIVHQLQGLWRTNDGIVKIEDFNSDNVELFVKYLYGGEVAAEQLAIDQLLELARMGKYYVIAGAVSGVIVGSFVQSSQIGSLPLSKYCGKDSM